MLDILAKLENEIKSAIFVPNSMLPERYHNNKSGGRTLNDVDKVYNKKVKGKVSRAKHKNEKARRIAAYRSQVELQAKESVEIEYDVDEHKLYNKQLAFVGGMVRSGMIDASELEE